MTPLRIWLVVPCYNEGRLGGECLTTTAPIFSQKLSALVRENKCSEQSRICYIDDGSTDDTWEIICELARHDNRIVGIRLSRNRGHQNALLAGLMEARDKCDAAISIDCDGQDDINAIDSMIDAYRDGCDIVYGVRSDRASDTFFKRFTAEAFYGFMKLMGAETVFNHADYRMMSSRALNGLAQFNEVNIFLRGIVPLIGYPSKIVEYSRAERVAGKTHYPLKKMLSLAIDGITSLSVKPIRLISAAGICFSFIGFIGVCWAIVSSLMGHAVAGWTSIVCAVCLLGGLQLLSLGIIGEYVGKIYLETKERPRYIISEVVGAIGEENPDD